MLGITANPTPTVLQWARRSAGLSAELAAKKIGVRPDRLLEWESGSEKPTIAQLRKLGAAYKRPVAAFYLQSPPKDFDPMRDFRRHPEGESSLVSPELQIEIRRGHDRREWALELLAQLGERPKNISLGLHLEADTEEAAIKVRDFLGVTVDLQKQWKRHAFTRWRNCIENAGILTFEMTSVPVREARGFSIGAQTLPVAVANIKDAFPARAFTLIHEVVHILLNSAGVCDLDDSGKHKVLSVEAFCNRVAGAVIFPKEGLLRSETVRRHRPDSAEWNDQELRLLAEDFGGSRESALIRLVSLGLTTQKFCDARRVVFREEYRRAEEKKALRDGFVPPHQIALLSAGSFFVSLVVENLNRDRITSSDFSDYLQIRAKHIPEVQNDYAGFSG